MQNSTKMSLEQYMPDLSKSHKLWSVGSALVIPTVGVLSKIMAGWLNKMTVHNREVLIDAIDNRKPGIPLITVSNHYSCLDDPVLWGMLDWRHFFNTAVMRWSAAASDICFTNNIHARFFCFGKTFPIVRGKGIYQKGMEFCLDRLNEGCWIHFFPEGRVNENHEHLRLKWGIGRLISICQETPIVIPFFHMGMDDVLPNRSPYIPRIGKVITVLIGDPLNFEDMRKVEDKDKKRKMITDTIQNELGVLRDRAERLHLHPRPNL